MADDEESGLFAIDVDADDYAETAAGDTPSTVPRTFQSDEDFAKQKASYTAKINADNFEELLKAVPVLSSTAASTCTPKSRLGKKDAQLLGYVVGEFYYNRRYNEIIQLCHLVRQRCEMDTKTSSRANPTGSTLATREQSDPSSAHYEGEPIEDNVNFQYCIHGIFKAQSA